MRCRVKQSGGGQVNVALSVLSSYKIITEMHRMSVAELFGCFAAIDFLCLLSDATTINAQLSMLMLSKKRRK
jgi:hypothetical protein